MQRSGKTLQLIFIALICIALFYGLNTMELRDEEPHRAIISKEMILSKEWIVPKYLGWNYYHKPPLFNWLLACSFLITGSSGEVAVRLPSIIALLLTAVFVYIFSKKYIPQQAAVLAAFFLLVSADILFYGSVNAGEIDLVFSLLIFLQLICIFHYSQRQKWLQLYLFSYSILAASILTKGYPALLFQVITLPAWFIYNKQFKKLFCWQHLTGIVLCSSIIALYFFAYSKKNNVLVYCLLLLNDASQKTLLSANWSSVFLNVLQSPLQLLYISFPGSLCFLLFFNKTFRANFRKNKLFSFAVLVIAVNIPVYIITSYTPNRYLYPLFPFIAIAAAYIFYTAVAANLFSRFKLSYSSALKVVIVMAALRIVYNVWGINAQVKLSNHLIYRNLGSSIVAITKNKPIYITGKPHKIPLLNSWPLISYNKDSVALPPLIAHQIPYYILQHTNTSVQYHHHPQKGFFYIAPIEFIQDKKVHIYKRFFDYWQQRELALVVFL